MENEGLEALKELRENGAVSFSKATISFTYLAFTKRADTIEKELKEYEMEHTLRVRLENINYELVREKQENEKKLKALKVIVKTLDIRVSMNKMGQCFLEDNHCIYAIPRSTYDLLKEVLNGQ